MVLLFLLLPSTVTLAQPTVLGTSTVNGTYTTYNLNTVGGFRQMRLLATATAASGVRTWEFAEGTAGTPSYTNNWRPYTAGQTLSAYNTQIDPASATSSARYNSSSGGQSGLMPGIVNGRYYTFNVTPLGPSNNNFMAVLETSYNPVTIPTVTQLPAATTHSPYQPVTVTATTSGTPGTNETVYLRYSNNSFTTSTIVTMTGSGTTWSGTIPGFPTGNTVAYYVFTAPVASGVTHTNADMLTLNLNNNGGANYSYSVTGTSSPMCGTYTINSGAAASATNFLSFASAINTLNTNGISGGCTGITFNVAAGTNYTESNISLTQTGSATCAIIFQKSGGGVNPKITALPGTKTTAASDFYDAIISLNGADYITFDGVDLADAVTNTTNATMMEYGFALYRTGSGASANGCQNNTFRNGVITMGRNNGATLSTSDGTALPIGIYGADHTIASTTALGAASVTSAAGNSSNTFTKLTIENVTTGIRLKGIADASAPYTGQDASNTIGGVTAGTPGFGGTGSGVLIRNFTNTQASSNVSSAVRAYQQQGLVVRNNTFDNAAGTGTTTNVNAFRIVWFDGGGAGTWTCSNNTFTITSTASVLRELRGVQSDIGASGNFVVSNNTFTVTIPAGSSSSNVYLIAPNAAHNSITVSGNVWDNNGLTLATTGTTAFYANLSSGTATTTVTVQNNKVRNVNRSGTSGTFYGFNDGVGSPATTPSVYTLTGNRFSTITLAGTSTFYGIRYSVGGATRPQALINNDTISTIVGGTGSIYAINFDYGDNGGTNISTVNNNVVSGLSSAAASGTGTGVFGIYLGAAASSASNLTHVTVSGNQISSLTNNGTAFVYGINVLGSPTAVTLSGNTISTITAGASNTNGAYGIFIVSPTTSTISQNTVSGLAASNASATLYGIRFSGGTTINLSQNVIHTVTHSHATTGIAYGILSGGGTTINATRNKIYNISAAATSATVYGYYALSGTTQNLSNNVIGDIRATASNASNSLAGINLSGGSTHNVYYNTVYLAGTSSGANFGSAAFTATSASTLDLRNNIFVNLQTPTGTGKAAAFRRSGANTPSNLAATSDNNAYYAGSPGTANVIFFDGTNFYQTLAGYQSVVAALSGGTREDQSITENHTFVSTTGSSADFLRLAPLVQTKAESGGTAVGGVTDEYDNAGVRTGYPLGGQVNGGGTAPDMGAYEDDMTPVQTDLAVFSFVSPAAAGCIGANPQTITVRIRNLGTTTVNFATNNLTLGGGATDPAAVPSIFGPVVVNTGTLAPGADLDVVLTTTYNMSALGSYSLSAVLSLGIDGYAGNNSGATTRTVAAPIAGTLTADISSFCGSTPTTINLTLTGANNGDAIFEQSTNGGGLWTTISTQAATGAVLTYAATGVTLTSQFRVRVECSPQTTATTSTVTVTNLQPTITANDVTICTGTQANLTASAPNLSYTRVALQQDFNSGIGSWTVTNTSTGAVAPHTNGRMRWQTFAAPYTANSLSSYSIDGTRFAFANADSGGSGSVIRTRLISPVFSLAGHTGATLSFQQYFNWQAAGDSAIVEISTNGGTTWATLLSQTTADVGSSTTPNSQSISLASYLGQTNLRIRFRSRSAWGWYWALDNVRVSGNAIDNPTYSWSPPTGLTPNATSASVTTPAIGAPTSYIVTVTYPGISCSNTKTVNIFLNPLPTATLSNNGPTCVGGSATVSVALTGTGPWSFTYFDGTTSTPVVNTSTNPYTFSTGALAGNTTYSLTALNDALCTATTMPTPTTVTAASTLTWNGSASTNWYTPANWTPACVPSSTLSAIIPTASTVVIASGTGAVNDLDVQGTGTLTVNGTGNLDVTGTFTTAGSGSFTATSGTTNFVGSGAQPVPAGSYNNLTLTGATAKVLTGDATLAGDLNLSAGMLRLDNFDLTLADNQTITGFSNTHFVVEDGTGVLTYQSVGGGETVVFPIGTTTAANDYTPAKLTNNGTSDDFTGTVNNTIPQGPIVQPGGPHVVGKTWDISEAVAGGSNATLVLGWNTANEGAFFDRTLSAVSHFVGGVWDHPWIGWGPAVAGTFGSTWERGRASLTSFSPFAMQDANMPLPVTLTTFQAERQDKNTLLTWETASERNSKGFEVQVSTAQNRGAASWRALGFVASETPTSNTARRYTFTDAESGKAGVRYYRLKQMDLDGTVSYSATRVVTFGAVSEPTIAVWPNPFAGEVTLELAAVAAGSVELTLTDALGRTVWQQTTAVTAGVQQLPLALPASLRTGAYVLSVTVDGQALRRSLIKQ